MSNETPFRLRLMRPEDSAAVYDLIAEKGGVVTTHFVVDAYDAMITYADLRTVGVVAEVDGYDGVAGVATVRSGLCQYNGKLLPFAGLDSVKVGEAFRRRGLGAQLVRWRVDWARAELGEHTVIVSGTSSRNIASQRLMQLWNREFVDALSFRALRTTRRPPRPAAGLTVREAHPAEYAALARLKNSYYREHNFYCPVSAEDLAREAALVAADTPVNRHFVAVTDGGELIAGATVRDLGDVMVDHLHLPRAVQVANRVLRLLPPDNIVRSLEVKRLSMAEGGRESADHLLATLRYLYRDRGTVLVMAVDPRSPFAGFLAKQRWLPLPRGVLSVWGPEPLDRDRPIYLHGRA